MAKRTCTISDCGRVHYARGWCNMHYNRWLTHGDPLKVLRVRLPGGVADRLWARVDVGHPLGCWEWTGQTDSLGYGLISVDGTGRMAHRVAYELLMGSIPEGLVLDHLCRNPPCVNPDHMEPVTNAENYRRGYAPPLTFTTNGRCKRGHVLTEDNIYRHKGRQTCALCRRVSAERANRARGHKPRVRATHCKRGHAFDEANTRIDEKGAQRCRACHRVAATEWRRRQEGRS